MIKTDGEENVHNSTLICCLSPYQEWNKLVFMKRILLVSLYELFVFGRFCVSVE